MIHHFSRQFEMHEHIGHGVESFLRLGITRTMLFTQLDKLGMQFSELIEEYSDLFRIRSGWPFIYLFIVIIVIVFIFVFIFVIFFLTGKGCIPLDDIGRFLGNRYRLLFRIRIDKIKHDLGQALPAFLVDDIAVQQGGMRVRKTGQCDKHLFQSVFDTLGDDNFTLAGQKFNRAHFAHIHTHGISGASDFGLNSRQGRRRFFNR